MPVAPEINSDAESIAEEDESSGTSVLAGLVSN